MLRRMHDACVCVWESDQPLLQFTLLQWSHVRAVLSGAPPFAADLSAMVWQMLLDHTKFSRTTMYVSSRSAVVAVFAADAKAGRCCPWTSIPTP